VPAVTLRHVTLRAITLRHVSWPRRIPVTNSLLYVTILLGKAFSWLA